MSADTPEAMNEWIQVIVQLGGKKQHENVVKEGQLTKEGESSSKMALKVRLVENGDEVERRD